MPITLKLRMTFVAPGRKGPMKKVEVIVVVVVVVVVTVVVVTVVVVVVTTVVVVVTTVVVVVVVVVVTVVVVVVLPVPVVVNVVVAVLVVAVVLPSRQHHGHHEHHGVAHVVVLVVIPAVQVVLGVTLPELTKLDGDVVVIRAVAVASVVLSSSPEPSTAFSTLPWRRAGEAQARTTQGQSLRIQVNVPGHRVTRASAEARRQ